MRVGAVADGSHIPYNTCRNVEWQVCAAKGTLPGQGSRKIKLARAPRSLAVSGHGNPALGSCPPDGYHPQGCETGFASSDIFFLEVCFYSMMCRNREDFFNLQPWQDFYCQMDWEGFEKMRNYLLKPKV